MIVELFTSGVEGIPVSYSPRTDDTIALTLLVCFFLSSNSALYVFSWVEIPCLLD